MKNLAEIYQKKLCYHVKKLVLNQYDCALLYMGIYFSLFHAKSFLSLKWNRTNEEKKLT